MAAAHAARVMSCRAWLRVPRLALLMRPGGARETLSCRSFGFGLPWWQHPLGAAPQRYASGGGRGPAPPAALSSEVCSLRGTVFDVPGPQANDLAELLLAEGAQSAAVEEFRPVGGPEQVRRGEQARGAYLGPGRGPRVQGALMAGELARLTRRPPAARAVLQEIYEDRSAEGAQFWDRCSVVAYWPPKARRAPPALPVLPALQLYPHSRCTAAWLVLMHGISTHNCRPAL